MTLVGPVVLDIVQHFIERWNEIKKRKVGLTYLCRTVSPADVLFSGSTATKSNVSTDCINLILIMPCLPGDIHGSPSHTT
jgi:hypothetical protein